MGIFPEAVRRVLAAGDEEFNSGNVDQAGHLYDDALRLLPDPDEDATPGPLLVRAVVLHRLAAVRVFQSDDQAARHLSDQVQAAAQAAEMAATTAETQQFAGDLASSSLDQLTGVFGQLRSTSYHSFPRPEDVGLSFTPSCQHGCPAITTPCGYIYDHCP